MREGRQGEEQWRELRVRRLLLRKRQRARAGFPLLEQWMDILQCLTSDGSLATN